MKPNYGLARFLIRCSDQHVYNYIMNSRFSKYIPTFDENCNKYTRGHVVIFAGSVEYSGAAILCSKATSRAGAGYVELFTPAPIQRDIALKLESIVVRPLRVNKNQLLDENCFKDINFKRIDSLLIGPGIRTGKVQYILLKYLLDIDAPLVVDADAIEIFGLLLDNKKSYKKVIDRKSPIILTPHTGELKKLLAYANSESIQDLSTKKLVDTVQTWVKEHNLHNVVVVAKGPNTTVISDNSDKTITSGTSSLATAGTGDVLAGCIASFMAQTKPQSTADALNVCSAAVETHALAGEISALTFGKHGVMAGDVADSLGLAIDALLV